MGLRDQLVSDLKQAMKQKDSDRLKVLRSLKAKMMEKEISIRKDGEGALSEEEAVEVLMKAAKQRKESIEQFREGGREELAVAEEKELEIIEAYLPEMLDEADVREVAKETIQQLGASDMSDMGKVMGVVMGKLKGKADGSVVSKVVKDELSG